MKRLKDMLYLRGIEDIYGNTCLVFEIRVEPYESTL
jgi:hypothetical protein